MKRLFRSMCILLFVIFVGVPVSVRADVAPPGHPPGSNPEPGTELTQVRMAAETVVIDVQASTPQNSLGQAKVTADFTMRNMGSEAESMGVRFPLASNNGFGDLPEIKSVSVKVNGSPAVTRRIMQEDPVWGSDPVPWAEFDVSFPPNQDVNIQVMYLLEGTGEYPFVSFNYIFHTGAGWYDTIGSADLIVRLPYEANELNVLFGEHTGWSSTAPGGVIQGQEIRWHFDNFEPEQSNDFEISLVMPSAWQKVLKERSNVNLNPNDGEAWGRLGKLYKELILYRKSVRFDAGGQELYRLGVVAYERAVTLLPNDALWHAGFADLLGVHAYYASMEGQDVRADMLRSMQEIHRALEIAPDDPKVKEIAEKIYFFFPNAIQLLESGYDYLWLTATPAFSTPTLFVGDPTLTPSVTNPPPATETTVPADEATLVPSPTPATATNPLCGSAALVLFLMLGIVKRRVA